MLLVSPPPIQKPNEKKEKTNNNKQDQKPTYHFIHAGTSPSL